MKKGQTIFVKVTVGTHHISGYKGKIIYVTKKDGEIKSIRLDVSEQFSTREGLSTKSYLRTFNVENKLVYEVFENRDDFVESVTHALRNLCIIFQKSITELSTSFLVF
jgi:ribosome biogenesis protein Nip4